MKPPITGRTRVAAVVGRPVVHSLSPLIHNAWLAGAGIDGAYVALEVDEAGFRSFLEGIRATSLTGLNVTVPFKEQALAAAQDASARARRAGAANVLVFSESGTIRADNTDGLGMIEAFADQAPGCDLASGPVVVLGAGGAARGAVGALIDAGCADIRVVNRTYGKAEALTRELAGRPFAVGDAAAAFEGAAAVINATSAGLADGDKPGWPLASTPADCVIMDMVYKPLITPFLAEAQAMGRRTVDGLAMLIGQAKPSFEAFFGQRPPADVDVRKLCLEALGQ